jgi:2-(1,2-epoxy-1,2-dihydrophenyl)acetyl-CoA isomerase
VKIGLTPDCGGSFLLPRAVGEKIAAELFMTGDAVDANRALQIGMINRVVAADALLDEASAMAKKLAAMPTGAIGRIKQMLNTAFSNDLQTQLALEHQCQIESGKSNDFKEGVTAFFEKRLPDFTGT